MNCINNHNEHNESDDVVSALENVLQKILDMQLSCITTVRIFTHPPLPIYLVCKAVCILLNKQFIPNPPDAGHTFEWWPTIQKMLNNPKFKFEIAKFTNEQKDKIPEETISKIQPLLNEEAFSKMSSCGVCTGLLHDWVIAIVNYHNYIKKND